MLLVPSLSVDPIGQAFLRSDRRGMLFNEIAAELKTLVAIVEKSDSSNGTGSTTFSLVSGLGSGNSHVGPLVFRPTQH